MRRGVVFGVVAFALAACQRDEGTPPPPAASSSSSVVRPAAHLELIDAPGGAVEPFIAAEFARATRDHAALLVYEGAVWCEPCVRFHRAAAAGELDAAFPTLRLLVFDADRDDNDLARAGYHSQFIPLFAIPDADGTASGRQIEGGTKGDRAVSSLTPRLRALLAGH